MPLSAETALRQALTVLYRASQGKIKNPYQIQAARAILTTLHDAGIKPTERDIRVVFRRARDTNAAPTRDGAEHGADGLNGEPAVYTHDTSTDVYTAPVASDASAAPADRSDEEKS